MSDYKTPEEKEKFEQYRRQMHPELEEEESKHPLGVRLIFSLIMVVVYIGVGILLMLNYFNWAPDYTWLRWFMGVLLVIYGAWRAFRAFKNIG